MANPTINELRLTDATILVGPDRVPVQGYGEDKFTFGPVGDVGSAISGVDGDVTLVLRKQNLWVLNITLTQGALGVGTLMGLYALQTSFALDVKYGAFTFSGFAWFQNIGEVAASLGTTSRSFVLNCAYVSGNITGAPGNSLTVQ